MKTEAINDIKNLITTGTVKENFPLKSFTTIKIGGQAALFVQTKETSELQKLIVYCVKNNIPYFILGGGSNFLFSDDLYDGVVIKLPPAGLEVTKTNDGAEVTIGGGYIINLAAIKLSEQGLSGFESVYGLPGSVGGAVYMNSKWPEGGYAIGDVTKSVEFLTESGEIKTLQHSDLNFSYGHSALQKMKGILLNATFTLKNGDPAEIKKKCDIVMSYRKSTQPTGVFTAGCVFKNITDEEKKEHGLTTGSAGYLIDKAGLKNFRMGGLTISPIHANFFINDGTATYKDFIDLSTHVKDTIKNKFGIILREEVLAVHS